MSSTGKTSIVVVCGIDSQVGEVEETVRRLRELHIEPVAAASFGCDELPPQELLVASSRNNDYPYYDAPRQDFLPDSRDFHCCELLAMFTVSRHWAEEYDVVYQVHNDMTFHKDFRPLFERHMLEPWSFVAPTSVDDPALFAQTSVMGGWGARRIKTPPRRISQMVVAWNSKFILALYEHYKDDKRIYEDLVKNWTCYGDLALFNLSCGCLGYGGRPIFTVAKVRPTHFSHHGLSRHPFGRSNR